MVRALCLIKNWHDLAHDLAHQFKSWNRSSMRKNVIEIGNRIFLFFFLLKLIKWSPCKNESTSSHGLCSTLTVWTIEIVLNHFSKIFNKIWLEKLKLSAMKSKEWDKFLLQRATFLVQTVGLLIAAGTAPFQYSAV